MRKKDFEDPVEEAIRKITSAHKRGTLKPRHGQKDYSKYTLQFTELIWARNFWDGWQIEVFEKRTNNHITTVKIGH
jgi:hypothetical protein